MNSLELSILDKQNRGKITDSKWKITQLEC